MTTVLHLMESSDPGGAEKMLISLIERLDAREYRSLVGTWRRGWLNEELERRGVPVVVLPLKRRLDPSWFPRSLKLVRQWRVDLVHAHEFAMNTYGSLLARLAGLPIVTTVHGKGYYGERLHRRIAYRLVARASFRMVAVSEDVRRFLAEEVAVRPGALVTIYNGIEPLRAAAGVGVRVRRELGIAEGTPVVGAIGNLFPVKGHTYLVRAMARIVRRVPSATLLLSGRPILKDELEAEARALGVAERVRILGFRDDVPALLDAMDVFALPSLSEGLSLSLLEAMAAGRPVVATRVGGNPELVRDGETGFLVPPRDPDALAARVVELLAEPARARALGEAGRRVVVEGFSLEGMLRRYEALYAAGLAAVRS